VPPIQQTAPDHGVRDGLTAAQVATLLPQVAQKIGSSGYSEIDQKDWRTLLLCRQRSYALGSERLRTVKLLSTQVVGNTRRKQIVFNAGQMMAQHSSTLAKSTNG
jgi:hypothetical protein